MDYSRGIVIRSFLWKLLERVSVQGLSLCITLVIARILDPQDYGIVALIVVFTGFATVIIDGGLNTALIQKKNADNVDFSTIFFGSIGLAFFLYAILYLSAPLIASFYNNESISYIIRVFSVIIIFEAANAVQRAYVAKHMLFKKLFNSSLVALVASGAWGIYLAINNHGVWALVFQSLSNAIINTIVMWFTIKWRPDWIFSFSRFKSLFNYGWKIFAINMMVSLYQNLRSLIIGKVYSPASLAFFERGHTLSGMVVTNINTSMQTVIFPVFSYAQDDPEKVKKLVRRSVVLSCTFIIPALMGLCLVAKPLIILILTEKWLPAVPFVQIFSVAYMLFPMQVASMEAVKAMGYSGFSFKYEVFKHLIETGILIVAVYIGIYAMAISVIFFNAFCLLINIYPNIRFLNYNIKEQINDIFMPFVLSFVMGIVIYWIQFLPIHNFWVILLQIITGIAIYFLLCEVTKMEGYVYVKSMVLIKFFNK